MKDRKQKHRNPTTSEKKTADKKNLVSEITNPEPLTPSPSESLHTPTLSISLGTSLPELSLTPILRDPNIRVLIDSTIDLADSVGSNRNFVSAAVKGDTELSVSTGHVQVLSAELVDGVDDAPVLFQARDSHELVFAFLFGEDGGGEEEGAEGCDEEGEAGDADHGCDCLRFVR